MLWQTGNSFLLSRLLFSFLSFLLLGLLCLFWMASLLMTEINYTCKASLCMCKCLSVPLCLFLCMYTSFCACAGVCLSLNMSVCIARCWGRGGALSQGSRDWEKVHKLGQSLRRRLEATGSTCSVVDRTWRKKESKNIIMSPKVLFAQAGSGPVKW